MAQKSGWLNHPLVVWVAGNFLGVLILVGILLVAPGVTSSLGLLGTVLILTLPLSLAQWLALRRFTRVSSLWILSLPLSMLLASAIIRLTPIGLWESLGLNDESVFVLTISYLVAGFLLGLPQWLLLRRHHSPASVWLLGSTVGLGLGFFLILATDWINNAVVLAYVVVPLVYAFATGLALVYLVGSRERSSVAATVT